MKTTCLLCEVGGSVSSCLLKRERLGCDAGCRNGCGCGVLQLPAGRRSRRGCAKRPWRCRLLLQPAAAVTCEPAGRPPADFCPSAACRWRRDAHMHTERASAAMHHHQGCAAARGRTIAPRRLSASDQRSAASEAMLGQDNKNEDVAAKSMARAQYKKRGVISWPAGGQQEAPLGRSGPSSLGSGTMRVALQLQSSVSSLQRRPLARGQRA